MGAPIAALASNKQLSKSMGIPEEFKPVIGAVFGYATDEKPAKEHVISVNKVL